MNDKHFIWIVPILLIIGFIIGYISGLHIPKEITFSLDKDTLAIFNCSLDVQKSIYDNEKRYVLINDNKNIDAIFGSSNREESICGNKTYTPVPNSFCGARPEEMIQCFRCT